MLGNPTWHAVDVLVGKNLRRRKMATFACCIQNVHTAALIRPKRRDLFLGVISSSLLCPHTKRSKRQQTKRTKSTDQVHQGEELKGSRVLRVPSTLRLADLSAMLIRSLRQNAIADLSPSEFAQ